MHAIPEADWADQPHPAVQAAGDHLPLSPGVVHRPSPLMETTNPQVAGVDRKAVAGKTKDPYQELARLRAEMALLIREKQCGGEK